MSEAMQKWVKGDRPTNMVNGCDHRQWFAFMYNFMTHLKTANIKRQFYLALAMAVGFSMKQGTKEIRTAADNIQNCLSELIGPHSHKILFMLIPRPIRQFIPLKYWPCKYFCLFY